MTFSAKKVISCDQTDFSPKKSIRATTAFLPRKSAGRQPVIMVNQKRDGGRGVFGAAQRAPYDGQSETTS